MRYLIGIVVQHESLF